MVVHAIRKLSFQHSGNAQENVNIRNLYRRIMEEQNQLQRMVATLPETKAKVLLEKFNEYFEVAAQWEAKLNTLIVTDEDQIAEMKMAGEARKFLKKKRTEIENTRKEMKEDALREGNMIDGIAKVLKGLIEPLEAKALNIETFAERAQQARIKQLHEDRVAELTLHGWSDMGIMKLGEMADEDYGFFKDSVIRMKQEKEAEQLRKAEELKEQQRQAEIARIEREKRVALYNQRKDELIPYWDFLTAEQRKGDFTTIEQGIWEMDIIALKVKKEAHLADQQRIAIENENLRAQQEQARQEEQKRAAAHAQEIQRIRAESDQKEAELRKAQAEHQKEIQKAAERDPEPATAPTFIVGGTDKAKLELLAKAYQSITIPTMTSAKGMQFTVDIATLRNRFTSFIMDKANQL
jgi:hypothetical protein